MSKKTNEEKNYTIEKHLDANNTRITSSPASTADGTSVKSFRFLSGRMTLLIPQRCAANTCSNVNVDESMARILTP